MTDLITSMLLWISTNTGYTLPATQPNIVMIEPYQLCQRYGIRNQKKCAMLKVKGIYDKNFTVYLQNDFDQTDIEDRSRLLHELVH